jgi:CDP-glucose 4,6-dehydratase
MEGLGMNPKFWKGKRILVTGHTGFKGGWLALWLQNLGANVIGYSLQPPTNPNLFEIANVGEGMKSLAGDVRDLEHLKLCIIENKPEIIIHMAAQSLVRLSYDNPVETYGTNVMGTVYVLEAVRYTDDVKVVIVVTSDKCYENKEWVWGYRENEPMGGYDPYSNSKGCAELVTAAYRSSYFNVEHYERHGVALASVRAGNVIGGGDWAKDRLIPDIMNAFMEKRPVMIRNPNAVRPWQYVLEPLNGYLTLAERLWEDGPKFAEGWNFGANEQDTRSVSWIADFLSRLWGSGAHWKYDFSNHPHEANYLRLDCSKARARLNWSPKLSLKTALEWIVEWYQGYWNNEDMRQVAENQINRYQDRELI